MLNTKTDTCRGCYSFHLKNASRKDVDKNEICNIIADVLNRCRFRGVRSQTSPLNEESVMNSEYWSSLQYFVATLDHLNRMDALGYGIKYKTKRLKKTSSLDVEIINNLQKWIKFEMIFRDANNAIYTTYKLLDMLEMRLHFIKLHSLKLLKPKNEGDSSAINANPDITGEYNKLIDVWESKMCNFSEFTSKQFKLYVVNIVKNLREIHPKTEIFTETRKRHAAENIIKRSDPQVDVSCPTQGSHLTGDHSIDSLGENKNTLSEGEDAFISTPDDIFDLIRSYYKRFDIIEESNEECINRLTDLNDRLLPKFVRTILKLPIFYEPYLNASVCPLVEDVGFQASDTVNKHFIKTVSSQWLTRIRFVRNVSKTGLEVLDTVRCAFGGLRNNRKIVIFSQGIIKDLFISSITHHTIKTDESTLSYAKHLDLIRNIKQNKSLGLFITDLASDEIDFLIQNDMPSFKWSAPILPNTYEDEDDKQKNITDFDFNKTEEDIWMRRLTMFKRINEKHVKNIIRRRNSCNNIKYGLVLDYNYVPLKVLCDFQNYIPIKYNMKTNLNSGAWIMSLFNNKSLKNCSSCINIEVENDLYPAMYLFGGRKINVLIVPIHQDYNFDSKPTFRNLIDISHYKTDYTFYTLSQQCKSWKKHAAENLIKRSDHDKVDVSCPTQGSHLTGDHSIDSLGENKNTLSEGEDARYPLGSYFVSFHTNMSLGMLSTHQIDQCDQVIISMIFHLASCNTSIEDDISSVDNAEDTEVIIKEMENIRPILKGLDEIMDICNSLKVSSITIPASLKCCYKINDKIIPDFAMRSSNHQLLESNRDYARCLALISHLAARFNKSNDFTTYINLIFPIHLKETLLPKMACNIFSNHVDVF